jgi:hypothetical protein
MVKKLKRPQRWQFTYGASWTANKDVARAFAMGITHEQNDPLRTRSPQTDCELTAEKQILGFKLAPRLEQVDDEHSECVQGCKHRFQ